MCNYYRYFHEGFWRYIYLPEDATTKLGSSPKLERVNVIEMKDAHDPCAKIYTLHSHYIFVKGTWESVSEFLSEKYGGKYGGNSMNGPLIRSIPKRQREQNNLLIK